VFGAMTFLIQKLTRMTKRLTRLTWFMMRMDRDTV
jgi:hypothetical protein